MHGRPLALYSDKHGVFKVNHKGKEHELTQFGRAIKEFGIANPKEYPCFVFTDII